MDVVKVAEVELCAVHPDHSTPLRVRFVPAHASNPGRVSSEHVDLVLILLLLRSPAKILDSVISADPIDVVDRRFALWVWNETMSDQSRPTHRVASPVFVERCNVVAVAT